MPRKKVKIEAEEIIEEVEEEIKEIPQESEKEKLLALYKKLKDLGINSIGDLENKISRAED